MFIDFNVIIRYLLLNINFLNNHTYYFKKLIIMNLFVLLVCVHLIYI